MLRPKSELIAQNHRGTMWVHQKLWLPPAALDTIVRFDLQGLLVFSQMLDEGIDGFEYRRTDFAFAQFVRRWR